MRLLRHVAILTMALTCVSNAPYADSFVDLPTLNARVEQLYVDGEYASALPLALQALLQSEQIHGSDHLEVAHSLNNLAEIYSVLGRYDDAQPLHLRALAIREQQLGLDHPDVALSLNNLASHYEALGQYAQAEPLFKRALAINEKAFGPVHQDVALSLNNLAALYDTQTQYAQAKPLYLRALAIREQILDAEHLDTAQTLNNLGLLAAAQGEYSTGINYLQRARQIYEKVFGTEHVNLVKVLSNLAALYRELGQYDDAEPLYQTALTLQEKTFGPTHPAVAQSLGNLATFRYTQGRYKEALTLSQRALTMLEQILGPKHPDVGVSLNNLATLYGTLGQHEKAVPLYQRALTIFEEALGPQHPHVAQNLSALAELYRIQGQYARAEPLSLRALAIREHALGTEHPLVGTSLNGLASLYYSQGRYTQAEPLLQRALAIFDRRFGPEHPQASTSLNNLAGLYLEQGRYADAEPLLQRALAIREKQLSPTHPDLATSLNNLAEVYRHRAQYTQAKPMYERALAIREQILDPNHPDVAASLNNLALLHQAQSKFELAEPLLRRALTIKEQSLGPLHPAVATSLNNLAQFFDVQERYALALPLYQRALAINEKALGNSHPDLALTLGNLGALYEAQGRLREALPYTRRATAILLARSVDSSAARGNSRHNEQQSKRGYFMQHVRLLEALQHQDAKTDVLRSEALEIGQLATTSSTAQALSRMAVRFGSGKAALAQRIRAHQDALARWIEIDQQLVKALGKPPLQRDAGNELTLRRERDRLDQTIKRLEDALSRRFPQYTELTNPKPAKLKEIQFLLANNEALLAYLVDQKASYLWIVRKHALQFIRLDIGRESLAAQVQTLSQGLRLDGITDRNEIPAYPVQAAHALYQKIFAPALPALSGVTQLLIVPDAALQSLPFSVLVSAKTAEIPRGQFTPYRDTPWLINDYTLTTLPSIGTLRALRHWVKASTARKALIGFGDPILKSALEKNQERNHAQNILTQQPALHSLPETARELKQLAKILGGDIRDLYLGPQATESQVKQISLTPFRTIAFATHSLVAGQFDVGEPALVLTSPEQNTPEDDGLLTASEVAQLKLNADWVVLSACDTAAADGTPGAEGLSGLARAFFYAGARALLVSHWPVDSVATLHLSTRMFESMRGKPKLGRAAALRHSMRALMRDKDQPNYFAHPSFWAPFVVVGEGRAH